MSSQSNFKEGLKGTTLFGGVGVLSILISILKSKIIAVLLGPMGMGVLGLFNSAVDLINKSTNFSLRTSAVKDISSAFAAGDNLRLSRTYSIFSKLILLTSILGFISCVILSPYLSKSSFDNYNYVWAFILLALSLPLLQMTDGLNVLMQGTRNLKMLAKANVFGSLLSLLCVIPVYYFWGVSGIALSIVLGYVAYYLVAFLFADKIKIPKSSISFKSAVKEGKGMVKMGFLISLQGILVSLSAYVIRAFISNTASVDEVGLYTAGFYIVNTYTGIVFSGMSTEYYPRIASMDDNNKVFEAVNSQSELSIMLLSPLLCAFILLGDIVIKLLYSDAFLGITMMVNISLLGIYFKAPSWCLGYVFLGKGDSKAFFFNEFITVIYTLVLNMLFYKLWGLTGMGTAFLLSFFIYWIQNIIVCRIRYGYSFHFPFLKTFLPHFFIALLCLFLSFIYNPWIKYSFGVVLLLISALLSYKLLKDRVDLNVLLSRFKKH